MSDTEAIDILSAARRYHMFSAGESVVVAVSGGPDSIAMLHALHTHSHEFEISLHAAHLNHGIRGKDSDADEEFVRTFAEELGVPLTVERVDVPTVRAEMRLGIEEAAREVRYKFLQETATNIGAAKIAVGHTADDRAESVLLNIIRGAGIDGLGAIRPVRGNIVRPLIATYRAEIEQYVRESGLAFRVDETNLDITYARNRVRHELIPLLEASYNPALRKCLVRLSTIAAEQSDFVREMAVQALGSVSYRGKIDAGLLLELPDALQSEILRLEVLRSKGDLKDISFEQIDRVMRALRSGDDFTITLPSGKIYAQRNGSVFEVWRRDGGKATEPFDVPLQIPGTTSLPQIGVTLHTDMEENPSPRKLPANEALVDADAVVGSLRVRSVRPGDRIIPMGMQGTKKLQDVFVDRKVARTQRTQIAVVVDDEKVLWVAGVVSCEAGKVTRKTARAIHITALPD